MGERLLLLWFINAGKIVVLVMTQTWVSRMKNVLTSTRSSSALNLTLTLRNGSC